MSALHRPYLFTSTALPLIISQSAISSLSFYRLPRSLLALDLSSPVVLAAWHWPCCGLLDVLHLCRSLSGPSLRALRFVRVQLTLQMKFSSEG